MDLNILFLVEIITNIFETIIILTFLMSFFNLKENFSSKSSLLIIVGSISLFLTLFNLFIINGSIFVFVGMILIWYATSLIIFEGHNWFKCFYLIILCYVIIILTEFIATGALLIIFGSEANPFLQGTIFRLYGIIVSKLLAYFVIRNINYIRLSSGIKEKFQIYNIGIVFILNIVLSYIILNIYKTISEHDNEFFIEIVILTLIIIILNILILNISSFMSKLLENEINLKINRRLYESQKNQLEHTKSMIKTIRQRQHEYNHHLSATYILLKEMEYDKAVKYISALIDTSEDTSVIIKSNNSFISLIVSYKLSQAKSLGIMINADIDIPSNIAINEEDVAVILENLLDNAITACENVDNKYISISIHFIDDYLNIYVENASDGQYNKNKNKFFTTKKNVEEHGFGIENIKYIVKKNDGLIDIIPESDRFIIDICLLMTMWNQDA